MSNSKYIDVGFWPEISYPPLTEDERKDLPRSTSSWTRRRPPMLPADAALVAACDPTWKIEHPDEYAVVLAYLRNPERTEQYRGWSNCRVCGCNNGSQDWFKGPFRYPQGYVHYLTNHGFKPPQVVIDAAMQR